jgi:CheY-like chemotaxis protein
MLETIAIAEDEQDLRELLAEFLSTNGYRVLAAPTAAEFRAMVEFEAIDLAILDINMSGEDGLSLARWLNSRGSTGIIFATAVNSAIDRIVGLESGADDYVTKPYHMREMLARIRDLLRRRKLARAALAGKRLAAIASNSRRAASTPNRRSPRGRPTSFSAISACRMATVPPFTTGSASNIRRWRTASPLSPVTFWARPLIDSLHGPAVRSSRNPLRRRIFAWSPICCATTLKHERRPSNFSSSERRVRRRRRSAHSRGREKIHRAS